MAQLTEWDRPSPGRQPMMGGGPAWEGWVGFAGVMMILIGAFNVIDGLAALFKESAFVTGKRGLLVLDIHTWGWIWLIAGIVVLLAGIAVMYGRTWGMIIGIGLAAVNAVGHLLFLPAFPIWSILIIVLDITVIYALSAHGQERAS
jgi:hypothetical protein